MQNALHNMLEVLAQGVAIDPANLLDWLRTSALAAVVIAFIFGYIVPKPTHDDVKGQRDRAQAQLTEAVTLIAQMKGAVQESASTTKEAVGVMKESQATTKEAVAVLKQVVTTLDGHRQPARSRPGSSGG